MIRRLLLTFTIILTSRLLAQTSDQISIQKLMQSFTTASEKLDAKAYASLFGVSGVWDGPLGQNAIGPANIEKSADLMFSSFGALEPLEWRARPLAPDVTLVDVYQKMKTRLEDMHSTPTVVPTAPGSVGPRHRTALRTTLIFKKQNDEWDIVAARVADVRIHHDEQTTKRN